MAPEGQHEPKTQRRDADRRNLIIAIIALSKLARRRATTGCAAAHQAGAQLLEQPTDRPTLQHVV